MKQHTLRCINQAPELQGIVEDKARLFAQLVLAEAKQNRADVVDVVKEHNSTKKLIIIGK